jgi:N-glycosylase/DNA lyase
MKRSVRKGADRLLFFVAPDDSTRSTMAISSSRPTLRHVFVDTFAIRGTKSLLIEVKKAVPPVTIENIKRTYRERRDQIRARLAEFDAIGREGSDEHLWQEMVYCFFTGGCSARMGLNALEAVKPLLMNGDQPALAKALTGVHRYPNARSRYVVASREFLREHCGLALRSKLQSFDCHFERRDWLVREKGIKGLGYKEASHYLRNIGFTGYAILDKHVLRCLAELKIIDDPKPPNTRSKYLTVEAKLKKFTDMTGIDFDEMDLVLWSMKTGVILK